MDQWCLCSNEILVIAHCQVAPPVAIWRELRFEAWLQIENLRQEAEAKKHHQGV